MKQLNIVKIICLTLLLLIMNTEIKSQISTPGKNEPVTVNYVDLQKYTGVWYEIAKIPNSFQKSCASNTTATYKLREDGRIDVINRCKGNDGSINEAKGIAKVVDEKTNSKLKVSFVRILGISLFWGDYWIIGLDKDYKYAVVGSPDRKYGWILSRTPKLSQSDLNDVFEILRRQGYNTNDFEMTEQIY
jgi:apolipoprotein D and lipocalin family protein